MALRNKNLKRLYRESVAAKSKGWKGWPMRVRNHIVLTFSHLLNLVLGWDGSKGLSDSTADPYETAWLVVTLRVPLWKEFSYATYYGQMRMMKWSGHGDGASIAFQWATSSAA